MPVKGENFGRLGAIPCREFPLRVNVGAAGDVERG